MSRLPKNWLEIEIGEIANVVGGGTPKASDESNFAEPGTAIAWLTPADLSGYKAKVISHGKRDLSPKGLKISSATVMPAGSLLFSSRAPIGYVAIAKNEIATNQGFKSFVFTNHVDPSFAYYYLKSIRSLAESWGTGTTFKELSGTAAKKLPFLIVPLNEQIRIADKLDSLLAKVDAAQARLEKIPTLLKRFRQSVLAAATSGELTDSANWKSTTIDSLCESSFYGPRFSKTDYTIDGIPTIRTTDMTDHGKIVISDSTPRISLPDAKIDQFRVKKGDLLITRTGSIGVMAVFDEDYLALPSAYLIRFRFNHTVEVKFLYYFLTSPRGQEQMGFGVTTVAQPNINAKTIRAITIDLPSIEEQKEIVRRVESLFAQADAVEKQYLAAKQRLDRLSQALLAKAFRGELVPQAPNDEPAAELLKRIQAERQQAVDKPKRKAGKRENQNNVVTNQTKTNIMQLKDAPETYLLDLLAQLGGECHAEVLWKKSDLAIDDFYAKLKQEMLSDRIIEDKNSPDPAMRKLKVANR